LGADAANADPVNRPVTVVSYYFGNYHPGDPRNVRSRARIGRMGTVRNAKPRFPGHEQPHVLLGYQDDLIRR